jgi:exopolysaccharide biosynthesis polyprenyl glycosylphosphotransferase
MLETPDCSAPRGPAAPDAGDRLLLVGEPRRAHRVARRLREAGGAARLPIVGLVSRSGRPRQIIVHPGTQPVPVLGRIDRLREVVRRAGATDVIVAARGQTARRLRAEIDNLGGAGAGVRVHWVDGDGAGVLDALAPPRGGAAPHPDWGLTIQRGLKRALDVLGSAALLLLLSPLLIGVAAAIALTSGRPIFYTQERVGRGGRTFRIVKFRSMRNDAEVSTGPIWAEDHDRRCTPIGDWLRHTNIDELPQLWNVLMGHMSLVGPRPERPMFVETFKAEHADYDLRHAVPAGMTGWAQVHGWRGRTSLRKRLQYDLDYIERWSFWLDIRVLLMTIEHVLWGRTNWTGKRPGA